MRLSFDLAIQVLYSSDTLCVDTSTQASVAIDFAGLWVHSEDERYSYCGKLRMLQAV